MILIRFAALACAPFRAFSKRKANQYQPMKRRICRSLKEIGKGFVGGFCIVAFGPMGSVGVGVEAPSLQSVPPIRVNRTIPQVHPPKGTLEFSENPRPAEFFRARV